MGALYRLLSEDAEIRTVTFREYLDGNESRSIAPHPVSEQREVHDLFTGSWIDEAGSDPGVDLGTWIGEDEENRAWELLGATRAFLEAEAATPESAPLAFEALYMAEGSDWFWWFGSDQDSGRDEELDDLFRMHLRNVYRLMGAEPPPELDRYIVSHTVVWTHAAPVMRIQIGDGLTIRTHCPGRLEWSKAPVEGQVVAVSAVGGVMAGASRYQVTLGPFAEPGVLQFRFVCQHEGCPGTELCCDSRAQAVEVVRSA